MALRPATIAVTLLVNVVGQEAHGPYLAVVGVAANLKIDTERIGAMELIGLVVQEDHRTCGVGLSMQLVERFPVAVHAVVSADQLHSVRKR